MAELSSSIQPVPVPYSDNPRHLLDWAMRLVSWLTFLGEIEYPLEESLSLGGPGMASRMFSAEDTLSAMPENTFTEILGAPEAGKKRIVTYLTVSVDVGSATLLTSLIKKVDTTEYTIIAKTLQKNEVFSGNGFTQIILDGDDETLGLKTEVTSGPQTFHYYLSYLDVD